MELSVNEKLRMFRSGIQQNSCLRCEAYEFQIKEKDLQIKELKSYQKLLAYEPSRPYEVELSNLRKQLYELEINKMRTDQTLLNAKDELQAEIQKLHQEIIKNNQLSTQNVELKRQLLHMEQKLIQNSQLSPPENIPEKKFTKCILHMIKCCHPEDYFQNNAPTLKEAWKWLKTVLTDYMNLKKQSFRLISSSSQNFFKT